MTKRRDCLAIGLSPAVQKTVLFENFRLGEVNRSTHYFTDAAGKCVNVCRVLVQGGVGASCLTILGKENRGEFESLCERDSIGVTSIETSGRVRTCTTLVDRGAGHCTEIVADEPELITKAEEGAFKRAFLNELSDGFKAAVISGSRARGFSDEIIPFMVQKIKEQGILLFADYKGVDLTNSFISNLVRPDYVKINEDEFFDSFGSFADIETGIVEMSKKYGNVIVISRGAESTLAADNGAFFEIESRAIKACNPIGSGDSMMAGIVQGVMEGLSSEEAIEKGRNYGARNALSIHPGWILEESDGKRNDID